MAFPRAQKSPRSRCAKGASSGALVRSLETSSSYSTIAVGISTFPYIVGGWLLELRRAVPSAPLDESVQIRLLISTVRGKIAAVNPQCEISHKLRPSHFHNVTVTVAAARSMTTALAVAFAMLARPRAQGSTPTSQHPSRARAQAAVAPPSQAPRWEVSPLCMTQTAWPRKV